MFWMRFRHHFSAEKKSFLFRNIVLSFATHYVAIAYWFRRRLVRKRVVGLTLYVVILVMIGHPNLLRSVRHFVLYPRQNVTAILLNSLKSANSERITQAEQYFSSLNDNGIRDRHATVASDGEVTVALTIITVSRNRHKIDNYEPKYLTQILWKFHALLENWLQLNHSLHIRMSVCNADNDIASYQEANSLSKFVPMFSRFNQTHDSTVHRLEKEKQDYVFCLNSSLEMYQGAEYIFLVEDDALPADNLFEVLQHVLNQHVERSYDRGEFRPRSSNIAYVKFFHPEWLLNFISFQPEPLPELISYTALLSMALTAAYVVTCGRTSKSNVTGVLWKKAFMLSLIVVLTYGRPGISEWRRLATPYFYSYTPAPSCCTQAMLFPRSTALQTVTYLSSRTCEQNFGKDSVLDNMLTDLQMAAYLVQPNSFTHIGLYSTLRDHLVDPFVM